MGVEKDHSVIKPHTIHDIALFWAVLTKIEKINLRSMNNK